MNNRSLLAILRAARGGGEVIEKQTSELEVLNG